MTSRAEKSRSWLVPAIAAGLVIALIGGGFLAIRAAFFAPTTITAFFTSATAIYPGDDVKVSGVKVGTIDKIEPQGTQTKITMAVDPNVPVPADAKAVIVAQNLIAARYVQLTPAFRSSEEGPTLGDGAVIPLERTAVPVEWDEVKVQLDRLATDLGPKGDLNTSSVGRFIDSAANALEGNGDKLRETLKQLSGVGRILADGSGNFVDTIKNLQVFVTALRGSNEQIVAFNNRLATLSSVLDGSKSDLDAALTDLSVAIDEVKRFVVGTRDQTVEQIRGLTAVTQTLVDSKMDLEQVLHVTPNAFANAYNIYDPDIGTVRGGFAIPNLSNPMQFVCGTIGALQNTTAPETAKLCNDYLGPALRLLNLNYIPVPINPYLAKSASPDNIVYSEARLAPGGEGAPPGPPEIPPSVSAYTGLDGDVPPPAGMGPPGVPLPVNDRLPAFPSPALYPGAPVPPGPPPGPPPADAAGAPNLPNLLLPAESPPPAPGPAPGPPLAAEGTP
ncbi:mammalian cell entry protein [Mycobacterium antarcticum]|uniref:MCE family protein n=1 Tax=unclassified Mycolicibacterium TaxID=2636767 RepID=UPI00238E7D32|nr:MULTISPECIES: MCE family protein [unclassified Mycolicibacterium]BDX31140.1 mammalian cell entry protein [Mycolicibacterium sp. TUM20985]GLP74492.1 mammalian cell entry protein [Mycolicibacterium sp. TUM20983]GLP80287.1 mammalian cell entry protein [Mycolicibacterium sp. TUM20984]